MFSVIIPTFNEIKNGYLESALKLLKGKAEIIVVDSSSTDGTSELVKKYADKLISVTTQSRAERLNIGVAQAEGDIIILHHPRSILQASSFDELKDLDQDIKWGAFTHKFDTDHPLLRFTSWYSNKIRGDKSKIYYLDHCLFIRKEISSKVFPIPKMDIFEDTEICKRLKDCKGKRLSSISTTSAIRFETNGVLWQCLTNLYLKLLYKFNSDHKRMNKLYEKNTKLNSDYDNNRN